MSYIVLFGSHEKDGSTRKTVELVFSGKEYRFVDLRTLNISQFEYKQSQEADDFLSLVREILGYDTIILASPVYWYSISSYVKTFLDRLSELFSSHKELVHALEGRRLFLISSFGAEAPLGCRGFELPIRQTCHYLNIQYGSCYYHHPDESLLRRFHFPTLEEFQRKLFSQEETLELRIKGSQVSLRPAHMTDRQDLYEWMYQSDASRSMFGLPLFPEKEARTWEEFKTMWASYYFQQPLTSLGHVFVIEKEGIGIGGIAFHKPDAKNRSEIDIWMRSEDYCGKGLGSEALDLLTRYLYKELGIEFFWLQPSARNPRSIQAYKKMKFKQLPLNPDEGKKEFGFQDYHDSVYMLRDMSLG